jgi:hypothetical protein
MSENLGIFGEVEARLYDKLGNLKQISTGKNLVLDRGLNYILNRFFSRFSTSISSSAVTYRPDMDPFAYLILGFSDDGGGDPITPTATESNGEVNANIDSISASIGLYNAPKQIQNWAIPEKQTFKISSCTISGVPYFAVSTIYDDANNSYNSTYLYIYKINTSTHLFELFQRIGPYNGLSSVDFISIDGTTYMATSGYRTDGGSYSFNQYIYKFDVGSNSFISFQTLGSGGSGWGGFYNVKFFAIGGVAHLLFTYYGSGNSKLFYWNTNTFTHRQDLTCNNAQHACSLLLGSDFYLFISNAGTTTSTLWKWNGGTTQFASYQTITHYNNYYAYGCSMISFGGNYYMAVSYFTGSYYTSGAVIIYKWNGGTTQFDAIQTVPLKSCSPGIEVKFSQLNTDNLFLLIGDHFFHQMKLDTGTGLFNSISNTGLQVHISRGMDIITYDQEVYLIAARFLYYASHENEYTLDLYKIYTSYGEKGAILTTAVNDDFTRSQNLKTDGELANYKLVSNLVAYDLYTKNINKTDAIDINTTNAGYLTVNLTTATSDISATVFTSPYLYTYTHDDFEIETFIVHSTSSSDKVGLCVVDNTAAVNSLVYIINNGDTTIQSGSAYNSSLDTHDASASHLYFKISRVGSTITTYSKAAVGDTWTQRYQFTRADFPKSLQVGMVAFSSSSGGTYVPKFDYFKLNADSGPSLMDIKRTITFDDEYTVNTIGMGTKAVGTGTYEYPAQAMQWGTRVNITPFTTEDGDSVVVTYRIKVVG